MGQKDNGMVREYNYSESDDLYDQDILTNRKCPDCGESIVSCPDCTEYCSNNLCGYQKR